VATARCRKYSNFRGGLITTSVRILLHLAVFNNFVAVVQSPQNTCCIDFVFRRAEAFEEACIMLEQKDGKFYHIAERNMSN
jgi:hypothetical protein